MRPRLQQGDVFVVAGTAWYQKAIMMVEKLHSKDNDADYGHAGIITNELGDTFEALLTVRNGSVFNYKGKPILIARPNAKVDGTLIHPIEFKTSLDTLRELHSGKLYPFWRIPLHLFGNFFAKYLATGRFLVCSELVAKYLCFIRAFDVVYKGINPDDLADRFEHYRNFDIVYQGEWIWEK
jgi:hypothetical protein